MPKPVEQHEASSLNGASQETVPKRARRRFTASEKLRIVKEAEAAQASGVRGAVEALLRRERIYSSHLASWRQQLGAEGVSGLAAKKPGRKPKLDAKDRELLAMKKQLAKVERELRIAKSLIGLQKKAHEVLGIALPHFDETELDETSS